MLGSSKWLAAPLSLLSATCLSLPTFLLISTSTAATRGGAEQKVMAAGSAG